VRILVLGSGAREHSLVLALARHGDHTLFAAPGNAGTAHHAENVALDPTNREVVVRTATELESELVIIGPEAPLVAGVADALRKKGIPVFGPSAKAAAIEGSKSFAKDVMLAAGVPTGASVTVSNVELLGQALDQSGAPYVVKADGLAAGKGVLVTEDKDAAIAHAEYYLQDGEVVVEEFLDGEEVSLFFLADGDTVVPLSPAQDYKRAFDGDEGPNTGGMGSYSPCPWLPHDFIDEVTKNIAQPTIDELRQRGIPFAGLLYCGLIVTDTGVKVIEFNARFGDPETQAVMARVDGDIAPLLLRAANGTLEASDSVPFSNDAAVVVVLASEGYPAHPETGRAIHGTDRAGKTEGVHLAHAATSETESGLIATGGRVLSVVATAHDFDHARKRAYEALGHIELEGSHYRTDIAARMSSDAPH